MTYENKDSEYFSYCRIDLINFIPRNRENKILEIGAGRGDTLLKAKEMEIAKEVVGVELCAINDSFQDHPLIDKFIVGDIEKVDLDFAENYFDVILCGDVLEHLLDPWRIVRELTYCLKNEGIIIASIPNFREIKTLINIVCKGDFKYSNLGVMDETHLRFFCKKNMLDLFINNKMEIVDISNTLDFIRKGKRYYLNKLTCGLLKDFLVTQYIVVAKKLSKWHPS